MFRQTNADYTQVTYHLNTKQARNSIPLLRVWSACLDRVGVGPINRDLVSAWGSI